MKPRKSNPFRPSIDHAATMAVLLTLFTAPSALAATLYWDGGTEDILVDGNGASNGSTGTWDTTILNWDEGTSPHVAWTNGTNTAEINGGSQTITLGADITLGGITQKAGANGATILAGAGPYSITLGVTGNNTFSTAASVTAGRILNMNAVIAGASDANLVLAGPGSSSLTATGKVSLNRANTFSGGTSFTGTTSGAVDLTLGNPSALQNSTLTLSAACSALIFDSSVAGDAFTLGGLAAANAGTGRNIVLENNAGTPAAIALSVGNNDANTTYAGVLSGAGSFTKIGTGILTLSASNTYSGTTTAGGGILKLNNASAVPGGVTAVGGTNNLIITNGGIVGLTANTNNFRRARGIGVAQVQWTGSGGFAAYGGDRTVNLGGSAATMTWNNSGFVPGGQSLVLSAADSDGTVIWENPISFAGTVRTIQVDDGSAAIDARLNGALIAGGSSGLNKTGAGTLEITSTSNAYEGATTVTNGTLLLGASGVLPDTTNVTIAAATLAAGAGFTETANTLNCTAASTIDIGSGATLAFTDSSGVNSGVWAGTLNITGTFVSGSSLRFGATSSGLTGSQLAVISVNGSGLGTYTLDSNGYLVVPSASGFDTWKTTNSATGQTLDEDHDGDGVSNGVEYFIGGPNGNTTGFTALPGVDNDAGTLSVTFTKAADYAGVYGTDFVVETSATLANPWIPATEGIGAGFVEITGNEVKYTFPAGTKNFARLRVTGP